MTVKQRFIVPVLTLLGAVAVAQQSPADTAIIPAADKPPSLIDSTLDYEMLFQDFDAFMDSILSPHSYLMLSISAGNGFYNFEQKGTRQINTEKKLSYIPSAGYYHRSGLGGTLSSYLVHDGSRMNFYQYSLSPSFDYLKNRNLAAGIAFTRFITKDSLPFYTTPIQNELYAYFTYRKWWVRPTLSVSYGWGSRSEYSEREALIQDLRLRRRGFIYINTTESISDFSVTASLRHDFYWLDVLAYRDHIRLTPQLALTSGTQKFGFNQTTGTYASSIRTNNTVLYSTDQLYLDDELRFQPLSLTFFVRGEYAIGKFFVQPQLVLDYYFPASSNRFSSIFSVHAGFIL